MTFKTCDVVFVMHARNWISRVLAWFMQSKYSHVAIVVQVPPTPGMTILSETTNFEVALGWVENYMSNNECVMEVWRVKNLDPLLSSRMIQAVLDNHGKVYGYQQFISFGIRGLLARVGIKIPNFIRSGIICCGNVMTALRLTSVPTLHNIDPYSINTEELRQLCIKSDMVEKVYSWPEEIV